MGEAVLWRENFVLRTVVVVVKTLPNGCREVFLADGDDVKAAFVPPEADVPDITAGDFITAECSTCILTRGTLTFMEKCSVEGRYFRPQSCIPEIFGLT